jgi:hypothetical protein
MSLGSSTDELIAWRVHTGEEHSPQLSNVMFHYGPGAGIDSTFGTPADSAHWQTDFGIVHLPEHQATAIWERVVHYHVIITRPMPADAYVERAAKVLPPHLEDLRHESRRSAAAREAYSRALSRHEPLVQKVLDLVAETPGATPEALAREMVRKQARKSPWAAAIGPLYSIDAVSAELAMDRKSVKVAEESGALLAIQSQEGDLLFPVAQFDDEGRPLSGVRWIISQLPPNLIDRYMLASWLNKPRSELDNLTPWAEMRRESEVSERLRDLVRSFRHRMRQ